VTDRVPVRVMVEDAWDQVALEPSAATPLSNLKREALARARTAGDPDAYLLKYRGAEILDEAQSLGDAGVVPHSTLIVLSRRRRPVR
jgi:hypothetical protein